jgi:hypothetical protein
VAAAAALVLEAHPRLTAPQARAALRRGCSPCRRWTWAGTASSPCGNEDGTGAGTVVGSGAAIQCGRFRADRLDAGTVVTLRAALRAGQPLRALERSLPWRHVVLRPQVAAPATAVAVFAKTRP